ncbi:3-dehydroquinate synthase [candidate division WOR-3 bacterium 4484_100]|uniref:Multifunctional fusion protein n=1 Tax=candidate division WOR-3 bacterium 4484_100 TaxID=1936077 RepID=A0A1V4QHY1_UNCW3|nr:MAG: 3-dehydroquinate synthase [candidate division WOR-3 bacterium 4484_100]
MRPDNIILVGFMGVGKDTVAQEIARLTDYVMISTDHLIQLETGISIRNIFKKKGEQYFRDLEQKVVSRLSNLKNMVVATGGGIFLRKKNRNLLSGMGYLIHLDARPEVLRKRIARLWTRPLLKNYEDINRIYKQRQKIYRGGIKIDTSERTPQEVAREIIDHLRLKETRPGIRMTRIVLRTDSKRCLFYVGYGLFSKSGMFRIEKPCRALVISNPLVAGFYADGVLRFLKQAGIEPELSLVPDGESYKNIEEAVRLYNLLLQRRFSRGDLIVGLGGGVVCDLAGFVASTYKRGMGLIQIPTTLLAQVDAAIGGKNGLNHRGKNMLGTFYQPDAVFCDLQFLKTLSDYDMKNGLAEVIKYGVICDPELFTQLKKERASVLKRDMKVLKKIVTRSIQIKAEIVKVDEREETGKRAILNFGHTVAHIIETQTHYQKLSHGEAVAIGMAEESKWAYQQGYLKQDELDKILKILSEYKLPTSLPSSIGPEAIRGAVLQDKKVRRERLILPIPQKVGRVRLKEVRCEKFL